MMKMKKVYIQPKSEFVRCATGEMMVIDKGTNPGSGEVAGGGMPPHPAPGRVTILSSNGKVF